MKTRTAARHEPGSPESRGWHFDKLSPDERIEIGQKMLDFRNKVLSGGFDHPNPDMTDGEKINLAHLNRGDFNELISEALDAQLEARAARRLTGSEALERTVVSPVEAASIPKRR